LEPTLIVFERGEELFPLEPRGLRIGVSTLPQPKIGLEIGVEGAEHELEHFGIHPPEFGVLGFELGERILLVYIGQVFTVGLGLGALLLPPVPPFLEGHIVQKATLLRELP
jgi:hypothetical protein